MMLLLALLVYFTSMTLFNVGGSVPETGLGEVKQAPAAHSTARHNDDTTRSWRGLRRNTGRKTPCASVHVKAFSRG